MCGIIGYTGPRNTAEVLLQGLKKLEYRGYDSAGIALVTGNDVTIYKNKGKVRELTERLARESLPPAQAGIGHTRWATHGAPEDRNAHPHRGKRVVLVHNGIIENYRELKEELALRNIRPQGETDTEIAALYLDWLYDGDPVAAIRQATERFEGSFALGILFTDRPGELYAIRRDSPLIVGRGEGENFIASDIPAILEYTRNYYLPEEGELAILTAEGIQFTDLEGNGIEKEQKTAHWSESGAQKEGYPHFMLKEIHEQPRAVQATLEQYLQKGHLFEEVSLPPAPEGRIFIVGCGSAYHAGLLGKELIEHYARKPVSVEIASEFRYADPLIGTKDLVIVISQSGETADSMAALRLARKKGVPTLGIVNVPGSSLAREADYVLYTAAGPEISVATTKAYTCQVVLLALLALHYSNSAEKSRHLKQLERLPGLITETLRQEPACKETASELKEAEHLFFIGRGPDHAICCEASLKLKEISYLHSEAYAAGELKHGTISLIEEGTPVVAMLTHRERLTKTAGNIREVCTRGARVICITHKEVNISDFGHHKLELPVCPDLLAPIAGSVIGQLLAYYTAVARGNDVDQPRNLAKSVTVE